MSLFGNFFEVFLPSKKNCEFCGFLKELLRYFSNNNWQHCLEKNVRDPETSVQKITEEKVQKCFTDYFK